jgi:hypothetical protein
MNTTLKILNIIAIIALTLTICIWAARIQHDIQHRPVVIKVDRLVYDVTAADGSKIFIVEPKK